MPNECKHEAKSRQHLKTNTLLQTGTKMNQKSYNKCLINLVCSVCTGSICLLFVCFLHTEISLLRRSLLRRSVSTKTSGKYFPIQTSHSVDKPLIYF